MSKRSNAANLTNSGSIHDLLGSDSVSLAGEATIKKRMKSALSDSPSASLVKRKTSRPDSGNSPTSARDFYRKVLKRG
jgi:hypothetical protein